jgi:Tfp pilus assembly protein PilO
MSNTAGLGLIVLALGLGYFLGSPMYADVQTLNTEKAGYDQAIQDLAQITTTMQTLQQKLDSLPAADREKIETLLPEKPDTVKLVSDIDTIAARNGISMTDVSFTAANADSGRSVAGAPPARSYQSGAINFSFSSDYAHLRSFILEMESSLRLVDIRSVTATIGEKGVISYKVNAETYWLPKVAVAKTTN